MYKIYSAYHGKDMWVCPDCKTIAGLNSPNHNCKEDKITSPPRGQSVPDTMEAWKHHAHLMADLAETQREELSRLKAKINKLQQSRNGGQND